MKVFFIVTSIHFNFSMLFEVSHFSSAKVSPERRLNLGFRTQKERPFPLNRGVHTTEVVNRYKDYVKHFFQDQVLCSLNGGVPKERFNCILLLLRQRMLFVLVGSYIIEIKLTSLFVMQVLGFRFPWKIIFLFCA